MIYHLLRSHDKEGSASTVHISKSIDEIEEAYDYLMANAPEGTWGEIVKYDTEDEENIYVWGNPNVPQWVTNAIIKQEIVTMVDGLTHCRTFLYSPLMADAQEIFPGDHLHNTPYSNILVDHKNNNGR